MNPIEDRDTFLITGFGRSGTMFLASALNRSRSWHVAHEPERGATSLQRIAARFSRDRYGEVNSYLVPYLAQIPVERKAVILRHPADIALSVYNRHGLDTPRRLEGIWKLLDAYVSAGFPVFRFEEFTRDIDALLQISQWAGITDLELNPDVLARPVNPTRRASARRYEEIPIAVRKAITEEIAWFAGKHYPESERRRKPHRVKQSRRRMLRP